LAQEDVRYGFAYYTVHEPYQDAFAPSSTESAAWKRKEGRRKTLSYPRSRSSVTVSAVITWLRSKEGRQQRLSRDAAAKVVRPMSWHLLAATVRGLAV
jgi:hypothetical protein